MIWTGTEMVADGKSMTYVVRGPDLAPRLGNSSGVYRGVRFISTYIFWFFYKKKKYYIRRVPQSWKRNRTPNLFGLRGFWAVSREFPNPLGWYIIGEWKNGCVRNQFGRKRNIIPLGGTDT